MTQAIGILVPLGFFALVAFIVWVVAGNWGRRGQLRAAHEFNARVLERISSLKDFHEFLQSEHGAQLMDSLAGERSTSGPRDRVLRATHVGIVATTLGVGILLMAWRVQSDEGVFVGGIALALGLGYLISSAVSYRLAKALGVLDRDGRRTSAGSTIE